MKTTNFFLLFAGAIGIYIGASLLFTPIAFEASAAIPVANDVNLLSEIRSSGGLLLAAGVLIALGGFNSKATKTSLIISSLFYLTYGISRSISMFIDGIPGSSLIAVTIAELVIGTASIILLRNFLRKEKQ